MDESDRMSLVEYVNKNVPKYERSAIKAEIEKFSRIKEKIEDSIYQSFARNFDKVARILNSYELISEKLESYNELVDLWNANLRAIGSNDTCVLDEERIKELSGALSEFEDDMSSFVSSGRSVLHSGKFKCEDIGQILILTNDLVFVGRQCGEKYKLDGVYNYGSLRLSRTGQFTIKIETENGETTLEGTEDEIARVCGIYEEIVRVPTISYSVKSDDEYDDFLLKTEQYEKIKKIKHEPRIQSRNDLIVCIERMGEAKLSFLHNFLIKRFLCNLSNINKFQPVDVLIDDVFNLFWRFKEEQSDILSEVFSDADACNPNISLLIENEILIIFKYLKKRILFNTNASKNAQIMNQLKERLRNGKVDFGFIVEYLDDLQEEYRRKRTESAESMLLKTIDEAVEREKGEEYNKRKGSGKDGSPRKTDRVPSKVEG